MLGYGTRACATHAAVKRTLSISVARTSRCLRRQVQAAGMQLSFPLGGANAQLLLSRASTLHAAAASCRLRVPRAALASSAVPCWWLNLAAEPWLIDAAPWLTDARTAAPSR